MTPKGDAGMGSMRSSTRGRSSSYCGVSRVEVQRDTHTPEPYCGEAGTPWPSIRASRGSSMLARLRGALRERRFVLHYQPIACLGTGEISHYEALVRMVDEQDGSLVAPNLFLPTAERHSLIGEVDKLVIRKVVALLAAGSVSADGVSADGAFADCGHEGVRIAVNLSASSACDPCTLDYIKGELERRSVDPARLVVEITETAAISDIDQAKALCRGLEALGCDVALDDFGAGFGSFHYVKHLPFRYLKIDGDFIRELTVSHQDQLLVRALVQVARGMNMKTVAEFVTDRPTMQLLRELGVDYAQGFEVGRPGPLLPTLSAVA